MNKLITQTMVLLFAIIMLAACAPAMSTSEPGVDEIRDFVETAVPAPTTTPVSESTDPGEQTQEEVEDISSITEPTPEEENMTPQSESLTPKEPGNTLPTDAESQKAIESAQKNLAKKLDVPVTVVTFLHYQPRIWPDGSMGCRQGGKMYAPVEISGYIIRLQVEGKAYDMHGGMGRRPFLCQSKARKDTKPGEIIVPPTINE